MEDGAEPALDPDSPQQRPNGTRPGLSSSALHDTNATTATATHKRSHSGGILSRLSFLRSGSDATAPGPVTSPTKKTPAPAEFHEEPLHQHRLNAHMNGSMHGHGHGHGTANANGTGEMEPAMAAAIRQHKARKRKGSLRKTALLTTGRLMFDRRASWDKHDGRESLKSPPLPSSSPSSQGRGVHDEDVSGAAATMTTTAALMNGGVSTGGVEAAGETEDYDAAASASVWTLPPPSHTLKLDTLQQPPSSSSSAAAAASNPQATTQQLLSPTHLDTHTHHNHSHTHIHAHHDGLLSPDSITSPISRYTSTTDDDDHLTLGASAADLTRRRSTLRNSIATAPPIRGIGPSASSSSSPSPHSSADTEYWGWIILFATWIVFVVGMGSCLGVWSWAWDVGETPYAPPELEDDATLPIVGYYPALIVCTGVMAWVWCLVAWVGMKYFRHARFDAGGGPEDGD